MIHIACFDISQLDQTAYEALYALASPERKARADNYRQRQDAYRCVTAEALLRHALGAASNPTILRDVHGKPRVENREDFHFNLSHSGRWVVIAWGSSEVGIDVEQIREDPNLPKIARRHFTPEEQSYISHSPEYQPQRFFEIWTKKESYLKYLSTGLTRPLNSFNTLSPENVFFHTLHLPNGYCLTLCAEENQYVFTQLALDALHRSSKKACR